MNTAIENQLLNELALYLRPPGQGLYAVSSGKEKIKQETINYLGLEQNTTIDWPEHIQSLLNEDFNLADKIILAVPSDCGAGLQKGARGNDSKTRR